VRFVAIASVVILGLATAPGVGAAKTPKRTSLTGKISVLKVKTITVHGKRTLTCRITAASPKASLRGFALGTTARITCANGVLLAITRPSSATGLAPSDSASASKPDPEPEPDPSTTPGTGGVKIAPTVVGNARITALGGGQIEFGSSITCQLTSSSPSVSAYRVGSYVSYTCTAGSLTAIGPGEGV
jgi:hypothetical protein